MSTTDGPGRPGPTGTPPQWSADGRWWWDGGQWVPRQAPPQPLVAPSPGPTGPSPRRGARWWWVVGAVLLLLLVGGGIALVAALDDDDQPSAGSPVPDDEQEFIAAISDAQDAAQGLDESAVAEVHEQRTEYLCSLLPDDKAVSDWTGTVVAVEPDVDGAGGALSVRISFGVELWTTRNTFSELGAETLIEKDDPLYATLTSLEVGDDVTFSGRFLPNAQNCVEDFNVTPQDSVSTPTFFFDFSEVEVD